MRKSGEKTTRRGQEYSQHRSLRMLGAESMMRLDVVLGEARIGRERRLRVTLQSNFVLAVQLASAVLWLICGRSREA